LKALLDLEKTNAHRKQDQLAAQRAERQRKQAIQEYNRSQVWLVLFDKDCYGQVKMCSCHWFS
jgi:hypothetical protein